MSMTYPARDEAVSTHGGAVVDRTLRLIELDGRFAALAGGSVASLLGRTIGDVLPALEAPLRRVLADGQPHGPLPIHESRGHGDAAGRRR